MRCPSLCRSRAANATRSAVAGPCQAEREGARFDRWCGPSPVVSRPSQRDDARSARSTPHATLSAIGMASRSPSVSGAPRTLWMSRATWIGPVPELEHPVVKPGMGGDRRCRTATAATRYTCEPAGASLSQFVGRSRDKSHGLPLSGCPRSRGATGNAWRPEFHPQFTTASHSNMFTNFEYIWLDGATPTSKLRSKMRLIDTSANRVPDAADLPQWSFDGSSTYQAEGGDSDLLLNPVRVVKDSVRGKGFPCLVRSRQPGRYPACEQ